MFKNSLSGIRKSHESAVKFTKSFDEGGGASPPLTLVPPRCVCGPSAAPLGPQGPQTHLFRIFFHNSLASLVVESCSSEALHGELRVKEDKKSGIRRKKTGTSRINLGKPGTRWNSWEQAEKAGTN